LRRFLLIFLGMFLAVAGLAIMLVPVPLPPLGLALMICGLSLLATHSRVARRSIQRARHRSARLSRIIERLTARAPRSFRDTLARTRPDALVRYLRIVEARI
jgi:drug/metabolite transporter (DMT)-like permease